MRLSNVYPISYILTVPVRLEAGSGKAFCLCIHTVLVWILNPTACTLYAPKIHVDTIWPVSSLNDTDVLESDNLTLSHRIDRVRVRLKINLC